MSQFEFIFSLYSLLLGLSLVELLSGLGRTLKLQLHNVGQQTQFVSIGWLTPLLGLFVMFDLLTFWGAAWVVRDLVSISSESLMGIMLFASAYYLAAYLVFPDTLSTEADLDAHYFRVRRLVFAILFVLLLIQLGYYASIPAIADRLFQPFSLFATCILIVLMIAAFFVERKSLAIAVLAALILRNGLVYLA